MIDIRMDRLLTTKRDQGRVLSRFLTWAKNRGFEGKPKPSVIELRWSDDFTHLWVSKMSGLIEHGFETIYPEHKPIFETDHFAVYPDTNPAASVLLYAIRETTSENSYG